MGDAADKLPERRKAFSLQQNRLIVLNLLHVVHMLCDILEEQHNSRVAAALCNWRELDGEKLFCAIV